MGAGESLPPQLSLCCIAQAHAQIARKTPAFSVGGLFRARAMRSPFSIFGGVKGKTQDRKEKVRLPNYKSPEAISTLTAFEGHNLRASTDNMDSYYTIYSYRTPIAVVHLRTKQVTFIDNRRYSVTTSKHQTLIRRGLEGFERSADVVVKER